MRRRTNRVVSDLIKQYSADQRFASGKACLVVDGRKFGQGRKRFALDKRADAIHYATKLVADSLTNTNTKISDLGNAVTFADLARVFLDKIVEDNDGHGDDLERTHRRYVDQLSSIKFERLDKPLAQCRVADIKPSDIWLAINDIRKENAVKTANARLSTLRQVLHEGCLLEFINSNPAQDIRIKEAKGKIVQKKKLRLLELKALFEAGAVDKILAAADKENGKGNRTPSDWLCIAFAGWTGLRSSEQRGLRWKDVKSKTGVIEVRHGLDRGGRLERLKTVAAMRDVSIDSELRKALRAWRMASAYSRADDFVFCNPDGSPIKSVNHLRKVVLYNTINRAGLERITWHELRHYFVSLLMLSMAGDVSSDVMMLEIKKMIGHESITTTYEDYSSWLTTQETIDANRSRIEDGKRMIADAN